MIEYKNYDNAVIVSGDGDFACLVDYLYMHEKLLRLIVPNSKQFSLFLKHVAKEKIDALSDQEAQLKFVATDPTAVALDTDAAIDLLPTRSPLKYLGDKIKQLLKKPQAQKKDIPTLPVAKKPIQQAGQSSRTLVKRPSPLVKKPVQAQQVVKKTPPQPIQNNPVQKIQEIRKPFIRPVQVAPKPIQAQNLNHSRVQPLQNKTPSSKIQEIRKPFIRPVQDVKQPALQQLHIIKKPITPPVPQKPVQVPQTAPAIKKHIHKHYTHPKVSVTATPVKPIGTSPISSSQNKPISIKSVSVPVPPIPNKPRAAKPFVRSPRKKSSPQRYKSDFLE